MSNLDIDLRRPVDPEPEDSRGLARIGSWLWEQFQAWAPPILFVLVVRSVLFEPFQIPSGSMVPTLAIGDFIVASKFSYGLRIPFTDIEVLPLDEPKRSDIIVFIHPPTQSDDPYCWVKAIPRRMTFGNLPGPDCTTDYIKRIVGEPGDTIELREDVLYINGAEEPRSFVSDHTYTDNACRSEPMRLYDENLEGQSHPVLESMSFIAGGPSNFGPVTIPTGHYFVMGDNRDHSADSRSWGLVPRENVRGKALAVWLSFDRCGDGIRGLGKMRTERIGTSLN